MKTLFLLLLLLMIHAEASAVTLTWRDKSTNEDGFIIQQRIGPNSSAWTVVEVTDRNVTTYSLTPAFKRNAKICWRIVSYNSAGEAAASNQACMRSP